MTLDEIVAEMKEKPDPDVLLEWIEDYITPLGDPAFGPIDDAIVAYREGCDR